MQMFADITSVDFYAHRRNFSTFFKIKNMNNTENVFFEKHTLL